MYCNNCGTCLPNDATICTNCGAKFETVYVETYAPVPVDHNALSAQTDNSSMGLNILSWFVPIFGIIYYFIKKDSFPKKAKSALKSALIGIAASLVLFVIVLPLVAGLGLFAAKNTAEEALKNHLDYEYNETYNDFVNSNDKNDSLKPSENNASNVGNYTNWTNYTVYIEGEKISLPISYSELAKKTGCEFKDDENKTEILNGIQHSFYDDIYVVLETLEGKTFTVMMINDTNEDALLNECLVTSVIDSANSENNTADIVFPGNLRVGDDVSKMNIEKLFGEPSTKFDDAGIIMYTFEEDPNRPESNMFKISGQIDCIQNIELHNVP